ncbi:MAG: oligosaccharide flippase family protein [Candidatus Aenigmatarchaeota archaeon]
MKVAILSLLKGDLARSGGLILLASLSANIILFFGNLLLANQLGAVDFGVFKVISYLFTFFPILIEFGAYATLTKYISEFKSTSREKAGYLIKWFLKIRIFSYSVLIALILVFNEQIASVFLKDASLNYLVFPGVLMAGMTFFIVFQNIVLGFHKFKLFALSQFLTLTSSAVLSVLLSSFGISYAVLGWSFGFLIGNIFNLKFFFKEGVIKKTEEFDVKKIFMKFSLPVYFTWIIINLFTIIIPVLNLFFSPEAIGYFSFAFLFYFATLLVPTAISSVVFPKVSELNGFKRHGDAKNILKKGFLLYTPVFLIGILFVILFSDWLFASFFESYLPSLLIFKALVSFGLVFGFNMIYTNYLQGLGRVKLFALLILLQNIVLFAVSFVLLGML